MFINTNVVHKIEGLEADTSFYCWNIGLPDATDYVNYKYVNQIINTLDKHPYENKWCQCRRKDIN